MTMRRARRSAAPPSRLTRLVAYPPPHWLTSSQRHPARIRAARIVVEALYRHGIVVQGNTHAELTGSNRLLPFRRPNTQNPAARVDNVITYFRGRLEKPVLVNRGFNICNLVLLYQKSPFNVSVIPLPGHSSQVLAVYGQLCASICVQIQIPRTLLSKLPPA